MNFDRSPFCFYGADKEWVPRAKGHIGQREISGDHLPDFAQVAWQAVKEF
jgi:hypothetical protein